jgi:cyanophycinase
MRNLPAESNAPRSNQAQSTMRYLTLFALALCASCHLTAPAPQGYLLIVGGGLKPDNTEVLSAFASAAGAQTLVIPTASGVPEESAPGTQAMLAAHTQGSQQVAILDIRHDTPERAQDLAYIDPIHDATAVWFTGGDQSRILAAFRPGGAESGGAESTSPNAASPDASETNAPAPNDTPAYDALLQFLARDGLIAGTSAGAAMMSDPMIAGGTSEAALLRGAGFEGALADTVNQAPGAQAQPVSPGVKLTQGMGFFPYGMVDQHFLSRGRFGRLIVAMEATGQTLAVGIADNRALYVDLSKASGTAIGNHAVVLIDLSTATRDGQTLRGIRISLASSNDTLDFTTARVHPAPGKYPLRTHQEGEPEPDAPQPDAPQPDSPQPDSPQPDAPQPIEQSAPDPWSSNALSQLLKRLALDPSQSQVARKNRIEITLRTDSGTTFWSAQPDLSDLTVYQVFMDITVTL